MVQMSVTSYTYTSPAETVGMRGDQKVTTGRTV